MPATALFRLRLPSWLLFAWIACCLALSLPGAAVAQSLLATGAVVETPQVRAELVAHAPQGVAAGRTVWVGVKLTHQPHWHTYWKNSGDSGLPTQLSWELPVGVRAGDIQWPAPKKFPLGTLANYGYEGTVLLPVPLTFEPGWSGAALDVGVYAQWLACRQECIPEEGRLRLSLPAEGASALHAGLFETTLAAVPQALKTGESAVRLDDKALALAVQNLPRRWHGQNLALFVETPGVIETGAAWTQTWQGGVWQARVPISAQRAAGPATLPVVLALESDMRSGQNPPGGLRVELPVQGEWPPLPALPGLDPALQAALDAAQAAGGSAPPGPAANTGWTWWALLGGALLGGLILNLMPCVFPVLALKVLAFAQPPAQAARTTGARGHLPQGLAYTAGVVLSFMALGALLLGLRSAGEAIGWGFQLQEPAMVAALAALFTLIGLNLAGLFEFGHVLPSRLASLQARHPTADAFLTGALAVAIASPCTAPFMGASLGLAVSLPAWQGLAVFGVLGLGMALPFLLASAWPGLARALPRPGAWMVTLRQFMAFPMFATVVWLLWVLGQQSGINGVAALLALLVALALLVWALGLQGRARWALGALAALALLWLAASLGPHVTRTPAATTGPDAPVATAVEGVSWQAWSPERQAELLAQGRSVFVDYTAAWCVTCQFNKGNALADPVVLQAAAQRNIALLRADWTRRDPAVTAALAALGRNGVPVYALYRPGQPPELLGEVLRADSVRAAFER